MSGPFRSLTARTATIPARPDAANEDAHTLSLDGRVAAAVLVDGAGLPQDLRGGCSHPVDWYARTLTDAMATRLRPTDGEGSTADDPEASLREALAGAIGDVTAAHGSGCSPADGSPSSTLAAWRADAVAGTFAWAVLSDSSLFLRLRDGSVREVVDTRVDDIAGVARQRTYAELLAAGTPEPAARLEAHRRTTETLRNVSGGFWCCHHDPAAAAQALGGCVPLADVDAVVLASDGATRLVHGHVGAAGELSAAEFVAAAVGEDGAELTALLARVRDADLRHAEAARAAGAKPYDDATIVAVRF